ncbi:MAG: tRNA adenosine(34) deaminase TadA [Pseudomonadota bacterium]
MLYDDKYWMQYALQQARLAEQQDEVPIGAVLVKDNEIIASGYNQPIKNVDPTAHAEIICLRNAAIILNNYRLPDTTLYVSLEPCAMCAGAIIQARVKRLVYGAYEPRSGAIKSVFKIFDQSQLNHKVATTAGILEKESANLLRIFFKQKRLKLKDKR